MQKSIYMSELFAERIYPGFASTKKKPKTAEEYYKSARLLCDFAKKDFLAITTEDARAYFDYLKTLQAENKLSDRTIKMRFVGFNQLARYICAAFPEYMHENPFENIILPFAEENMKYQRIPSLAEIDKLLSAARDNEQMFLILCLISRMGLTAGECIRLSAGQIVETGENSIAISCIEKDGKMEILRPVPEDVKVILLDYIKKMESSGVLFRNEWNKPLTERNLDYQLKKYSSLAGIETKCSVKDLRNRAILSMLQANASPEEVSMYAGIGMVRVKQFVREGNILAECPADLVNYRIVKQNSSNNDGTKK